LNGKRNSAFNKRSEEKDKKKPQFNPPRETRGKSRHIDPNLSAFSCLRDPPSTKGKGSARDAAINEVPCGAKPGFVNGPREKERGKKREKRILLNTH